MFRTFLSWRYLLARRTNLIGVVGIFLGVFAPIVILAIMSGFLEENKRLVRGGLSDVVVEPRFTARPDGTEVEREVGELLTLVREDPRVRHATARLNWFGIVSEAGEAAQASADRLTDSEYGNISAVELVGIDVLTGEKIAVAAAVGWARLFGPFPTVTLEDELDAGFLQCLTREQLGGAKVAEPLLPFAAPPRYRPEGRRLASVVVNNWLFYYFKLRRGSVLHISTAVPDPETGELRPASRDFVVAGTYRSDDDDISKVYLARTELADVLRDGRRFSQVQVQLEDYDADVEGFCADLARDGYEAGLLLVDDGDEIRTWEESRQGLIAAVENERVMMGVMLGLVLVVAAFTIFAILSMLVTEKRRDIGILTALGATPDGVFSTFLLIGFWDALVGSALGAALGSWAAVNVGDIQVWLEETFHLQIFDPSVVAFSQIPSRLYPESVAAMVALAFVCTLVFASIPAWRAARLDPLEALRYE